MTAESEFKRAIELTPNDTMARLPNAFELAQMGRLNEAMAEIKRAGELDPLSLIINAGAGWHFYVSRQYEQAIEQRQRELS